MRSSHGGRQHQVSTNLSRKCAEYCLTTGTSRACGARFYGSILRSEQRCGTMQAMAAALHGLAVPPTSWHNSVHATTFRKLALFGSILTDVSAGTATLTFWSSSSKGHVPGYRGS